MDMGYGYGLKYAFTVYRGGVRVTGYAALTTMGHTSCDKQPEATACRLPRGNQGRGEPSQTPSGTGRDQTTLGEIRIVWDGGIVD